MVRFFPSRSPSEARQGRPPARSSATGSAAVELAVALPVLALLLVGTADFARVFYWAIEMTNAARAGAQYGAQNLGTGADHTAVETAATGSVNVGGDLTANASRRCECSDATATFTSTAPAANNCTDPPSTSCPSAGTFRVITITVTVTKTFSTFAPYPGIPRPLTFSRAAIMRVTE
jgi:Flp pilus assembly protein TadG